MALLGKGMRDICFILSFKLKTLASEAKGSRNAKDTSVIGSIFSKKTKGLVLPPAHWGYQTVTSRRQKTQIQ
jgi:hypothetical protein